MMSSTWIMLQVLIATVVAICERGDDDPLVPKYMSLSRLTNYHKNAHGMINESYILMREKVALVYARLSTLRKTGDNATLLFIYDEVELVGQYLGSFDKHMDQIRPALNSYRSDLVNTVRLAGQRLRASCDNREEVLRMFRDLEDRLVKVGPGIDYSLYAILRDLDYASTSTAIILDPTNELTALVGAHAEKYPRIPKDKPTDRSVIELEQTMLRQIEEDFFDNPERMWDDSEL